MSITRPDARVMFQALFYQWLLVLGGISWGKCWELLEGSFLQIISGLKNSGGEVAQVGSPINTRVVKLLPQLLPNY